MTKPKSKKGDKSAEDACKKDACQSDDAQEVANSMDPVNLADIMEAIKSMNASMNSISGGTFSVNATYRLYI